MYWYESFLDSISPCIKLKSTIINERTLVSESIDIPQSNGNTLAVIWYNFQYDFLFLPSLVFIHENVSCFFNKLGRFGNFVILLQYNIETNVK